MSDIVKNEQLLFDDSVKTSVTGKPILGTLEGPCADIIDSTRNGRKYTEELWNNVFNNNEIVKEYFNCGGIFGELGHPQDRTETDMEKIAICMPQPPKKGKDGVLTASFDILDTPCGRIAYTLAKYGYKLGVSSRGNGDTYIDSDGSDHVDEDTYDFQAFDLVLLPAVKKARLKLVTEGLEQNNFKKAINEALEKATDDQKKIMTETLHNLDIDYTLPEQQKDTITSSSDDNIDANSDSMEVDNIQSNAIKDLQNSLKENLQLQEQIVDLQKKLAVGNAKDKKLEEQLSEIKILRKALADHKAANTALTKKVNSLKEQVSSMDNQVSKLNETVKVQDNAKTKLAENISAKTLQIKQLEKKVQILENTINEKDSDIASVKSQLTESIATSKQDAAVKDSEYKRQIAKQQALTERYKTTLQNTINRYIECQATMLGVKVSDIKSRLKENYSLNDIDAACDSLKNYNLSMSKLPFNVTKSAKIKITESRDPLLGVDQDGDVIDDQLRSFL